MQGFSQNSSCLVLAPHLVYPARNGADILIDRRWKAFSNLVRHVDILCEHELVRYTHGERTHIRAFQNQARSKTVAGVRTLLYRSQYLHQKFVTGAFRHEAIRLLNESSYSLIVASFPYTAPILASDTHARKHTLETHNDDFKWYNTLRDASLNPVERRVASLSSQWSEKTVAIAAERDTVFLHLTNDDYRGYKEVIGPHTHLVAPIGVDIPDGNPIPQRPGDPVRLLFVGSLGVKMNIDALYNFADQFYPSLSEQLGSDLIIDLVGHAPSEEVRNLAGKHAWGLYPDAPDQLLYTLLRKASFTILPFEYTTGAKLKLPESLAHGVPFMATTHVQAQLSAVPDLCLFADTPVDWLSHVEQVRAKGQSLEDRLALVDVARQHSWEASAKQVYEFLSDT